MTKLIPTVTGTISPADMGLTSMHEHIPLDFSGDCREDAYQFALAELKKARALGLQTLVEVTPRRDVEAIRRIAEAAGINVIVCTGYYNDLTDEEKTYSVDQFLRHMLDEIEDGIAASGIYPGVIKIASANTIPNEIERRALTAAGLAQKGSGLPLCVHSVTGCKNQQTILEAAGADLSKVYFSHIEAEFGWEGRSFDAQVDYLCALMKKGSVLSFNNFGNWAHTRPEVLAGLIAAFKARGFADHQVATMDVTWSYENGRRKILWEDINPDGIRRTYAYLLSDMAPWLRANGIAQADVLKMIQDTPRRIFENESGNPPFIGGG